MNTLLFYPDEFAHMRKVASCASAEGGAVNDSESSASVLLALPHADERARHIKHVLCAGKDENKNLRAGVIGAGMGNAVVVKNEPGAMLVKYTPLHHKALYSAHTITVLLAHPRPPVLARLIKDCATLGVRNILVFHSALGEKSYLQSSIWQRVSQLTLNGVMQAGAINTVPRVHKYYSLAAALRACDEIACNKTSGTPARVYCAMDAADVFACSHNGGDASIILALGAERGLVEAEEMLLKQNGFEARALTDTIMRCETAVTLVVGMCAAAVTQARRNKTNIV